MKTQTLPAITMLVLAPAAHAALVAQYTFENEATPFADVSTEHVTANNGTASSSTPAVTRVTSTTVANQGIKQGVAAAYFGPISGTASTGNPNAYVTVANEADFDFAEDFTLALWALPTNVTGNRTFISKGNNWRFRTVTDDLEIYLNSTKVAELTNVVSTTEWKHYAVVVDQQGTDAHVQFYVNGQVAGAQTVVAYPTYANQSNAPRLGAHTTQALGPDPYLGYMDDVRIYNSALSPTDISNLVPEPASLSFLLLSGILLLRRRGARQP